MITFIQNTFILEVEYLITKHFKVIYNEQSTYKL